LDEVSALQLLLSDQKGPPCAVKTKFCAPPLRHNDMYVHAFEIDSTLNQHYNSILFYLYGIQEIAFSQPPKSAFPDLPLKNTINPVYFKIISLININFFVLTKKWLTDFC